MTERTRVADKPYNSLGIGTDNLSYLVNSGLPDRFALIELATYLREFPVTLGQELEQMIQGIQEPSHATTFRQNAVAATEPYRLDLLWRRLIVLGRESGHPELGICSYVCIDPQSDQVVHFSYIDNEVLAMNRSVEALDRSIAAFQSGVTGVDVDDHACVEAACQSILACIEEAEGRRPDSEDNYWFLLLYHFAYDPGYFLASYGLSRD